MEKKFKKLVVCCIVMCLMVTLTPSIKAYAITRNDVSQKLESLMKQYVGRTGTWSYAGGSQCYGFAHMIFDNVFNCYRCLFKNQIFYKFRKTICLIVLRFHLIEKEF